MCHVCVLHKTIFMCLTLLTVFLKYISKLLSLSRVLAHHELSLVRAEQWHGVNIYCEQRHYLDWKLEQFGSKNKTIQFGSLNTHTHRKRI